MVFLSTRLVWLASHFNRTGLDPVLQYCFRGPFSFTVAVYWDNAFSNPVLYDFNYISGILWWHQRNSGVFGRWLQSGIRVAPLYQ